jgi:ABC-type microcin C transport system permease subunit YejB
VVYFNFLHGFMDSYFAHQIQKIQASGASAAVIQAQVAQVQKSQVMYQNPLWNAMYTFIEPFPVGLVMTLISAALLRKKKRAQAAGEALPAA